MGCDQRGSAGFDWWGHAGCTRYRRVGYREPVDGEPTIENLLARTCGRWPAQFCRWWPGRGRRGGSQQGLAASLAMPSQWEPDAWMQWARGRTSKLTQGKNDIINIWGEIQFWCPCLVRSADKARWRSLRLWIKWDEDREKHNVAVSS